MALSIEQIAACVRRLRTETIVGSCIDMVPYGPADDANVVRLRSLPNVRYFMNLSDAPSLPMQASWRAAYEGRMNDVMWLIRTKSGVVCGTNRIYDIEPALCEKGSLIVDSSRTVGVPAALEAEVMVLNIAFEVFGVERVITHVRNDNAAMLSINSRFGFSWESEAAIRGEVFGRYFLDRGDWRPEQFQSLIAHFTSRCRVLHD